MLLVKAYGEIYVNVKKEIKSGLRTGKISSSVMG